MIDCAKLVNISLHCSWLCVDHTQHLDTKLCANGYCVFLTERIIMKLYTVIDNKITYPIVLLYLLNLRKYYQLKSISC